MTSHDTVQEGPPGGICRRPVIGPSVPGGSSGSGRPARGKWASPAVRAKVPPVRHGCGGSCVTERLPFEGLRVIDFTHVIAGPLATFQLAMMGADVVKIEPPGRGDQLRRMGGEPGRARKRAGHGLPRHQCRQALAGPRPQAAGGARRGARADWRGRRGDGELPPRRDGAARPRGGGGAGNQPPCGLLLALRLRAPSGLGLAAGLRPYRPGCRRSHVDAGRGGRPAHQDRLPDGRHGGGLRGLHGDLRGADRAERDGPGPAYRRFDDRGDARHDGDAGPRFSRNGSPCRRGSAIRPFRARRPRAPTRRPMRRSC